MIALVFILALSLPPAPQPVTVVFVQPAGETFTLEEQARAVQALADADAWWSARAPAPIALAPGTTEVVTAEADVYRSLRWSLPYLQEASPLTVFVIDNSNSQLLIGGDSAGEAQDYYRAVWVVLDGYPGADGLPATITHELGHVLYHLDDRPLPCSDDIMCSPGPTAAYAGGYVGCASLAALGAPCKALYLPVAS